MADMIDIPIEDGAEQNEEQPTEELGTDESTASNDGGEDLAARVAALEVENATLTEARLRAIADLDNARRRAKNDVARSIQYANEDLLKKLLPILDDFHRSVDAGAESRDFDSFFEGITLIRKMMSQTLGEIGVERIDTIGKPFDVEEHEALMRQPSDEEEGTVISELEPGYRYKDKVIRHAKVVVAG